MKKYLMGLFAIAIAVTLSSFTDKPKKEKSLTEYYWYTVDYSVPGGKIPSGASPVFGGVKKTQEDAQADDICVDDDELHCLRGFINMPTLPTTSYDETTPKPNQ